MKRKKVLLITVLTILLGAIATHLLLTNAPTTIRRDIADFSIRDTASIKKVFMADMNENIVKLERTESGKWLLNDTYEVRAENMATLFRTLIWIEVREPVPHRHLDDVLRLMAATSTKVEIYQRVYRINLFDRIKLFPHIKRTKTFFVGESTGDQMGTYMLMENASTPFVTYMPGFRGFLSTRFSAHKRDWRDPKIFRYRLSEIESVRIDFHEEPHESIKVVNNNDRTFSLYDVHNDMQAVNTFDTLKVLSFISSFDNISFEALVNHISIKDSILDSKPLHTITVDLFEGTANRIDTYKKWAIEGEEDLWGEPIIYDRDRMYAHINNGNDFVLIQYYVFDRILKTLSYFTGDENEHFDTAL